LSLQLLLINKFCLTRPDCAFKSLYCPHIPDNVGSWEALPNDESNRAFIQYEPLNPEEIISIENHKIPEGLTPVESSFSSSVVGNIEKQKEEELQMKVGETISSNIGALESSKNNDIDTQCSDNEKMKFAKLIGGFQKVYAWCYKDLRGFDPGFLQNAIPHKEGMKPIMQGQRAINSAFKATSQRELGKFLRDEIIFSVHPEWVSNWEPASRTTDNIGTCINIQTFRQAIMRNLVLSLNMEMVLQQVVESQLRPLLDSLLGCKKIKVKMANAHKTTLITSWGTLSYQCLLSSLLDTSTAFKIPTHTTLDELVSLHLYLDDLIVCVKGLIITSRFQVLGPFQIYFVLDTNSYILTELHKQLSSYNANNPCLKYCEGPT
jgi:hypothetical protein